MKPLLSEAFRAYRANSLMAWFAIISSFLLLLLFGISTVITLGVFGLLEAMRDELSVEVFMQDDATQAQIDFFELTVKQLAGVESVQHISKEMALQEFAKEFPEYADIRGLLGENPLPESYRITPTRTWKNAQLLSMLSKKLSMMPGVEEIYYGGDILSGAERFYKSVLFVTALLFVVVFMATAFIIFQTLRLTVTSRRDVIEIAVLVGAPLWKVRFPFVLNGIVYGFGGGALAGLALWGVAWFATGIIGVGIPGLNAVMVLLPLSGALLGLAASRSALSEVMPG